MVGPRSRQPAIKSPCLSVLAKRQKVGSSIRGTIWRSGHGAGLPIRRSAWKRFEPALAPSAILFFPWTDVEEKCSAPSTPPDFQTNSVARLSPQYLDNRSLDKEKIHFWGFEPSSPAASYESLLIFLSHGSFRAVDSVLVWQSHGQWFASGKTFLTAFFSVTFRPY